VNLSAWIEELKRRRVFRALAGYGLVSFALLQVVEPVMHGLDLPEWVLKVVVIGLGLGLPVTILVAWAYDVKATGIERTPSAGPGRGWRTVALVAIGLLLAAPGVAYYLVYRGRGAGPEGGPPAATGPSVAVLPFVNMSGDPENEYFSDGLSEEILNALAQVPGLRVPARTSSFAFKGKSENVKKIAAALEVATVLEGSVRKAGGRVRITAQLVKAIDGYHLWSQTFDRELKDVFAVQEEISGAIAAALRVQLAPPPAGGVRKGSTTTSPEAYEAYLKGRQALNERTRVSIEKAVAHLEKATALDPAFAVAWADRAIGVLLLAKGNYGEVPSSQAVARARPLVEKARALAPDHPEVLGAAGLAENIAYQPQRALELFERSLALNPSNGEVLNWRKGALEALGRYELLLQAAADAARADPLSKLQAANYIDELIRFGRDAELGPAVERLRKLDDAWGQMSLGFIAASRGDRAEVIRHLLPAVQQGCDQAGPVLSRTLSELDLGEEAVRVPRGDPLGALMARGDYQRAEPLALVAVQQTPADLDAGFDLFFARYAARHFTEAAELAARLDQEVHGLGYDPAALLVMADAARAASRPAEATRYRERASQLIERARRAQVSPNLLDFARGRLAAYDGRDDEAVALLGRALTATGFSWGRADLEQHLFARLLKRPDYRAALKRLDAMLAAQRAQVVAMLCGPDRISPTWQPAPESCSGVATGR
jgi:TolB-like protein